MVDNVDIEILKILNRNSRVTLKELGDQVHMSSPALAERIRKLEDQNVIKKYSIEVNPEKLGFVRPVFINVKITNPNHEKYLDFVAENRNFMLHHYRTTGNSNYLIEGAFQSTEELDNFLSKLSNFATYDVTDVVHFFF
ncbi:Lrp/AsnC family transcriptional regulator [Lactobacillus terrae]|uniref:Lrp/AsnC family transcriptional regulator n=1 Tax=Lactobacillus terrae TaxID=2269374 RepID=UPI000C1B7C8C|nr:Lrp/AsnC family transcriptional regulator [Lactobacillus terrae]